VEAGGAPPEGVKDAKILGAVAQRKRETAVAAAKLRAAYEVAIRKYTKARAIEIAKALRAEMEEKLAAGRRADALAEVTFEEDIGYTVATLEAGVASHKNAKPRLVNIPETLAGRPFTQQVSDRAGPVRFQFDTPGKIYLLTPARGKFPPQDEFMSEVAQQEDMIVTTTNAEMQVWSMTGDAGRVVESPYSLSLVADSLKKGKVRPAGK
jgi:hypothetical protein